MHVIRTLVNTIIFYNVSEFIKVHSVTHGIVWAAWLHSYRVLWLVFLDTIPFIFDIFTRFLYPSAFSDSFWFPWAHCLDILQFTTLF